MRTTEKILTAVMGTALVLVLMIIGFAVVWCLAAGLTILAGG